MNRVKAVGLSHNHLDNFQSFGNCFSANFLALGLGAPPLDCAGLAFFNSSSSAFVSLTGTGFPEVAFGFRGLALSRSSRVMNDGALGNFFAAAEPARSD